MQCRLRVNRVISAMSAVSPLYPREPTSSARRAKAFVSSDRVGVKRTHKGPLRDVLAKNMRRLRTARGVSQEALAHESGINRTYLSGVERSERNVSIDNIERIAKALETEPWKLLKGD
jgi:ribosome-binding protein aMBF1 (putative translation factor)